MPCEKEPNMPAAKPQAEENQIKRRTSDIREKYQCSVTVNLTRHLLGPNPTVTLERKTEHHHGHA